MRHPGPWKLDETTGFIIDANGADVCDAWVTDDPETRAILTRAAEMWEAVQVVASVEPGTPAHRLADRMLCVLANKISAEIAAAKGAKP